MYPLKVEAITKLPPPRTLSELQILQGKMNFLHCIISNYAHITKGFMRLLKKDTPFVWDKQAQHSFDELKKSLTNTPLLSLPNYNNDFLLYLTAFNTTISMVLVQTDDKFNEHVIYYLGKGLIGELNYAHVEKLALAIVLVIQCFQHYIPLRTTTIVFDTNPMQYILAHQTLGGKYSKWIAILEEFDLEFTTAKSKKSLLFSKLITELPQDIHKHTSEELLPDEYLFLINSSDPWYKDILIYLQT